jgi:hypothetical protein
MEDSAKGRQLRNTLLSAGAQCGAGVSDARICEFEHHNDVIFPPDYRTYVRYINGSGYDYGPGMLRFWSLDEVTSLRDQIQSTPRNAAVIQATYDETLENAERYFVFADVEHDIQLYAIWLSAVADDLNDIVVLDGTSPRRVAESFSEFIDLYVREPERLSLVVE